VKDEVRAAVAEIFAWHPNSTLFVTGYSMGASLALLSALDIKDQFNLTSEQINLYTFGQPRVGDRQFSLYVFS
jgi:predicted lipase